MHGQNRPAAHGRSNAGVEVDDSYAMHGQNRPAAHGRNNPAGASGSTGPVPEAPKGDSKKPPKPEAPDTGTKAHASGASNASEGPSASSKTGPTSPVEDVVEEAIAGSHYKLLKQSDGKLTLKHSGSERAYTITIHPSANLGGPDLAEVGDIIAKLLGVVEEHEHNFGGIKSVTFSGYGGSLKYHKDPELNRTVSFGGPSDQTTGTKVHEQLERLENLLGRLGKGAAVTFSSAPVTQPDEEAAKKAAAQAQAKANQDKAEQASETPASPDAGRGTSAPAGANANKETTV